MCRSIEHVWWSQFSWHPLKFLIRDQCLKCGTTVKVANGRRYVYKTPVEVFEESVERHSGGCLLWTRGKNDKGYPILQAKVPPTGRRLCVGAHRWAFEDHYGYSPPVVLHTCDTPLCVDWRHLRGGTTLDNMQDMISKGRDDHSRARDRLSPEQVREIRKRYRNETAASLSEEFGFSVNAVRNCALRYTYREVE